MKKDRAWRAAARIVDYEVGLRPKQRQLLVADIARAIRAETRRCLKAVRAEGGSGANRIEIEIKRGSR